MSIYENRPAKTKLISSYVSEATSAGDPEIGFLTKSILQPFGLSSIRQSGSYKMMFCILS